MTEDLFSYAPKKQPPSPEKGGNVPELTVSELAFSLKKTLEDTYGRIRIRGELSGIKLAASGHLYGDIKDENAVVNIVCWRGQMSRLSIRPEDGLDVIITGKVSSYPKSSRYQIIIESMELAGEGALLKMLEERRKALTEEGLFAPERKKALPFLPERIGVVTSPTGAVIRDIIHRVEDRFPRHILVWGVPVQGQGAAEKIAAAIKGFNHLPSAQRPDVLIVARGGGSLEDLMPFNEEIVVRAVAESMIPVISAVGHETDTTLIDYAADSRAPTPTGAAEMAVPVRLNILAGVQDYQGRLAQAFIRKTEELKNTLTQMIARLGHPAQMLELKMQALDVQTSKLSQAYARGIEQRRAAVLRLEATLLHPGQRVANARDILNIHSKSLSRISKNLMNKSKEKLEYLGRMLESLSYGQVLKRGYAVVRDESGSVISHAEAVKEGQTLEIEFAAHKKIGTRVTKALKG